MYFVAPLLLLLMQPISVPTQPAYSPAPLVLIGPPELDRSDFGFSDLKDPLAARQDLSDRAAQAISVPGTWSVEGADAHSIELTSLQWNGSYTLIVTDQCEDWPAWQQLAGSHVMLFPRIAEGRGGSQVGDFLQAVRMY